MLIWDINDNSNVRDWTVEQMLEQINRDRNQYWVDYDETDYLEGWDEFEEGCSYTRHEPR